MLTIERKTELDLFASETADVFIKAEGGVMTAMRLWTSEEFLYWANGTVSLIKNRSQGKGSKTAAKAAVSRFYGAVRTSQSRCKKLKDHWLGELVISFKKGVFTLLPREAKEEEEEETGETGETGEAGEARETGEAGKYETLMNSFNALKEKHDAAVKRIEELERAIALAKQAKTLKAAIGYLPAIAA